MDYLPHIATSSHAFLDAALDGPLETPVPSCPGWSMGDLLGHLGVVQRFHGGHLSRGVTDPPPGPRPTPPEVDLADWFRVGVDQLLATLAELGTDAPAWNFLGAPPRTAFWHRRMAHEAAVHRWDAELARGTAVAVPAELAVDGVDELLDAFLPSRPLPEHDGGTLRIRFSDVGEERVATFGVGAGAVVLSGPSSDVLLALWGRIPVTDLQVEGDLALARALSTR